MALIRVFEIPSDLTSGFLHGGPKPAVFQQVDWFRDRDEDDRWYETAEGRFEVEKFIRGKRYFRQGRAYLVLHPRGTFVIDYEAP